jgi:ribonuclease VapC
MQRAQLFLHVICLGEVYYITFREQGEEMADLAYSRIRAFPLNFIDNISEELLLKAASLKGKYPISYADSFAAALAVLNNFFLLSCDPEYNALEEEGILKMHWLS